MNLIFISYQIGIFSDFQLVDFGVSNSQEIFLSMSVYTYNRVLCKLDFGWYYIQEDMCELYWTTMNPTMNPVFVI